MRHEKLGSLDCRVIESPTTGEDGLTVVLLHGYGAPGEDLVPLAEFLGPHRYVFPVAPLELAFGYDARAWWEIDMEGLERALSKGVPDDFRRNVPEGLPEARAAVLSLLSDVERRLGIPGERIVLGGFSQAAFKNFPV